MQTLNLYSYEYLKWTVFSKENVLISVKIDSIVLDLIWDFILYIYNNFCEN